MGPVRERHSKQSPKSSPGQSPRRCSSLGGPQPLGHWKAQSRCLHLLTARSFSVSSHSYAAVTPYARSCTEASVRVRSSLAGDTPHANSFLSLPSGWPVTTKEKAAPASWPTTPSTETTPWP